MFRKLLTVQVLLCLVVLAGNARAQSGYIQMTSSGNADSVFINLTINDPGGQPGPLPCTRIGVTRGWGGPIVGFIDRVPGTTIQRQVVDHGLEPNTIYCYRVVLWSTFFNTYCNFDVNSICSVFDCFYDTQTCINTGPGPAFMGHGFLSTQNADGNEARAILYPCSGDINSPITSFVTLAQDAAQYVDSGIAVDVYGEPWCCWAQGMWLYSATTATPHSCVVKTEQKTWGAVKALYRE
ncbi:MAG TPA: hypothetical protein VF247_11070 [Candidatus Krumholzibacteria bacterium]